jgi:hypothetical protein
MTFIARISAIAMVACALASCGGGGGGGGSSTAAVSSTTTPTKPTTPSTPTSSTTPTTPTSTNAPVVTLANQLRGPNVTQISVNTGLNGSFPNVIYVTVTVCTPNTTNCVSIPNVQVDTGSTGLRVLASKVQSLGLPAVMNNGSPVGECAEFADGTAWGAVRYANVNLGTNAGGLTATNIPIQVVDDSAVVAVDSNGNGTASSGSATSTAEPTTPEPASCSYQQYVENDASTLGANGIIGIGYFMQDCGPGCTAAGYSAQYGDPFYYDCIADNCGLVNGAGIAQNLQVSNPVSSFPAPYNNGNIIELPSVPDTGASAANGLLVFGVSNTGTGANNDLPAGTPIGVDDAGYLTVTYNGTSYMSSFIDSGSSVYFFNSSITQCSGMQAAGFYCPATEYTSPSTTITGNGTLLGTLSFTFNIGNAISLFDSTTSANGYAFNNLGAPIGQLSVPTGTFDVGEPFFYGRSVFTVIENSTVGTYTGPFAAVGTAS